MMLMDLTTVLWTQNGRLQRDLQKRNTGMKKDRENYLPRMLS